MKAHKMVLPMGRTVSPVVEIVKGLQADHVQGDLKNQMDETIGTIKTSQCLSYQKD